MSGAKRSLCELEELVLLDVDEPAGPVVLEDELVALLAPRLRVTVFVGPKRSRITLKTTS